MLAVSPGVRFFVHGLGWTLIGFLAAPQVQGQQGTGEEWRYNGGDIGFSRYSTLDQIDAGNVQNLEIAWRRPTVDPALISRYPELTQPNQIRATPIMVGGVLYSSNGVGLVEALNPGTGETIWVQEVPEGDAVLGQSTRQVGFWADGGEERILSVRAPYLHALDAETGRPIRSFGENGRVDLRYFECDPPQGRPLLRDPPPSAFGASPCDESSRLSGPRAFGNSMGPLIVGDVAIVGMASSSHEVFTHQDPADVRGYDVRTGELLWTFRPIPGAGEVGVATWLNDSWRTAGAGDVWSLMSADPELGLVYLPTGAVTSEMYGGQRPGDNLFGSSIVALRADTGEYVWHFQTVRHDLWDYDNLGAPILVDITVDGRPIKALVQLTKQAMAYVLDRETGIPVWPMEERPVPQSATPGEWTAPTQPFPTKPLPFDIHGITINDLIDFTPELRAEAIEIVKEYQLGPIYTPPSLVGLDRGTTKGTLQMPGSIGGAEWGGGPFDPETGILYVPSITGTFSADLVPVFAEDGDIWYTRGRRELIAGPRGLPLTKPPYGRITAIDLSTGDHLWWVPNGDGWRDHPAIAHLDLPPLGQPGRAMSLLTKTLLFVSEGDPIHVRTALGGGPDDGKGFRAFDKQTGEVIWETQFEAGTNAPPMTYLYEGKQYIVLPIGSVNHTAEWVALALP